MPHHSHGNFSLSNPGEVTHSAAAWARSFVSLDFIHNYSYCLVLVVFHWTVLYWSLCRTIDSGRHHASPPLKFQIDISHPEKLGLWQLLNDCRMCPAISLYVEKPFTKLHALKKPCHQKPFHNAWKLQEPAVWYALTCKYFPQPPTQGLNNHIFWQ